LSGGSEMSEKAFISIEKVLDCVVWFDQRFVIAGEQWQTMRH
jgi:hypothetical protein